MLTRLSKESPGHLGDELCDGDDTIGTLLPFAVSLLLLSVSEIRHLRLQRLPFQSFLFNSLFGLQTQSGRMTP